MKKWMLALPLAFLVFTFTSCFDDIDNESVIYYLNMATVSTGGEYPVFSTDNGITYNSETKQNADSFAIGERYFLIYTCTDTSTSSLDYYNIQITDYQLVHVKAFSTLPEDSTDDLTSQTMMSVAWLWTGNDYLNAIFYPYKSLTLPNAYDLMRIESSESNLTTDTVPTIYFKLLHHVDLINANYYTRQAFSYDLSPLVTEFPAAYKFKIHVSWTASDANDSEDLVYVPTSVSASQSSLKKSTGALLSSGKTLAGEGFSIGW
jgi:hypothetical protein